MMKMTSVGVFILQIYTLLIDLMRQGTKNSLHRHILKLKEKI